jgi:hypothetical protein
MSSRPDWELSDFSRVHLDTNNIEILMHRNGSSAMVVWPWWVDPEDITGATWTAEMMGFEDITEVGNMTGYTIPEIECEDWDFMVLTVTK